MIETGTFLQQRYRIDKQIGQGGMGAVYVATDERFGSTVAIKETLCMDESFRKAIEREARLLNSLKHSALPRVSDHFEESESQFLVMEYIPGDDVAAMLENPDTKFTIEQIAKWADELLDALDYLHNQVIPVVHRDIKPQNLKVNSRGEIILLDFGLAKGNPTDASHQTAAKSIFGYSRSYASLEQIQGTGTDPRSDLYSLAATLYHLLTGAAPADALTRAMAVLSQKPDPLVPASTVNPEIPRGIAGVLQKALDLNASERPASANDMQQMLRESENYGYLVDQPTIATHMTDPRMFAQPTQIMSDATRVDGVNRSDAKTEILPNVVSQETAVRTGGSVGNTNAVPAHITTAPPQKGRGLGMAAGALLMLLVGGVIAGGLYVLKPSIYGLDKQAENVTVPSVVVPVTSDTNSSGTANINSVTAGSPASGSVPSVSQPVTETTRQTAAAEKPVETTKNTKTTASSKAKGTNDDEGETMDFHVDDPDIPAGGVVIRQPGKNGKMTTIRVNPAGPPPNGQRPPPEMFGFPRGIDMNNLTPQQRQKLVRAMRNNNIRPPKPGPQPTPPE